MSESKQAGEKESRVVRLLEMSDGIAHVVVSVLLLLLAFFVLVTSTVGFVSETMHVGASKELVPRALEYLSDLLFGVIILELLSTLLTYIKARKLEATIKDFMVVAIISSIRKILLVGAQSSTEHQTADAFIKEALGTLTTIGGILLLIGGFLLLTVYRWPARPGSSTD